MNQIVGSGQSFARRKEQNLGKEGKVSMMSSNNDVTKAMEKLRKPEKGLTAGQKNPKYKTTKTQERAVLDFAIKNKCVVTPLGWQSALEDYNEFGSCVCDPKRLTCPCEQAPQEIAEKGHCKCHLFWRDYETYMVTKNIKGD